MEAIVFDKKAGVLKYVSDRPPPDLRNEHDVVVRVRQSGVCGTDLHIIEGAFPCEENRPFVLGHEFCGVVEKAGALSRFSVGERVAVDPNSGCGACDYCHSGKYHLCSTGGISATVGIRADGGWARYCRVPDTQVTRLPDDVDFERGALTEPLSCLARGLDRLGPVPIGDRILICGAGIIGNLWAVVLHLQGHRDVTVSEPNKERFETIKRVGLDGYAFSTPDQVKTSGKFFDVIVDCTGVAKVLEDSHSLLAPGGRYVLFGCCNPKHTAKLNPFEMYAKESTIIAVNVNPFTFPKAIGLLRSLGKKYLDYNKLGIGTFALKDHEEAMRQLRSGQISKAVFKLD